MDKMWKYVRNLCRFILQKKNERKKREHKIFPMRNMAYLIIIIPKTCFVEKKITDACY